MRRAVGSTVDAFGPLTIHGFLPLSMDAIVMLFKTRLDNREHMTLTQLRRRMCLVRTNSHDTRSIDCIPTGCDTTSTASLQTSSSNDYNWHYLIGVLCCDRFTCYVVLCPWFDRAPRSKTGQLCKA